MSKRIDAFAAIVKALRLLAAKSEVQIEVFPDFVNVPDELALIFNDSALLINQEEDHAGLRPRHLEYLSQIQKRIEGMEEEEGEWSLHALRTSVSWEEIRDLARTFLDDLDLPQEPLDLGGIDYVRGKD